VLIVKEIRFGGRGSWRNEERLLVQVGIESTWTYYIMLVHFVKENV
jgi:hypothetical protein